MAVIRRDVIHQEPEGIVLTPEQKRSRRLRNNAIGLAIGLFVILIFVVTLAKLGAHILERPI